MSISFFIVKLHQAFGLILFRPLVYIGAIQTSKVVIQLGSGSPLPAEALFCGKLRYGHVVENLV